MSTSNTPTLRPASGAPRRAPLRLRMAEDPVLRIMVVPPGCTRAQGDEALLAGVTPVNEHSASDLLDELTRHPDADPCDQWGDDGGSWRHPDLVAPSFRTDT